MKIVEIKHVPVEQGKRILRQKLNEPILVPRVRKELLNGRWRAIEQCMSKLDPEVEKMVKAAMEIIAQTDTITTQRDVYYGIRGTHPTWTYRGMDLKEDKVYNAFTGTIMEKIQLFTGLTMQSLGVRAGPRGYIKGDGWISTPLRGTIPLRAMPALDFDLVDAGVEISTNARKVIHFEKDAGFSKIASEQIAKMIEAIFSTSQGYLVEAANKFLADSERRGMQVYCIHDADPHGMQMALMYGLASKNSAYMPTEFYPRNVKWLGLFPSVADRLGLPPEPIGDTHKKILPNLQKIVQEHPQFRQEVETLVRRLEQWEFQALSGLSQYASPIYLVEALRVMGDEIKYVPKPEAVKDEILDRLLREVYDFVGDQIRRYARRFLDEHVLPELVRQLREKLAEKIQEMEQLAEREIGRIRAVQPSAFREAVKMKLVQRPTRYWTDAVRVIVNEILNQQFDIDADIVVNVNVRYATADTGLTIYNLTVPPRPLTKNDIVEAIEGRIHRDRRLAMRIRQALESVFGTPDITW